MAIESRKYADEADVRKAIIAVINRESIKYKYPLKNLKIDVNKVLFGKGRVGDTRLLKLAKKLSEEGIIKHEKGDKEKTKHTFRRVIQERDVDTTTPNPVSRNIFTIMIDDGLSHSDRLPIAPGLATWNAKLKLRNISNNSYYDILFSVKDNKKEKLISGYSRALTSGDIKNKKSKQIYYIPEYLIVDLYYGEDRNIRYHIRQQINRKEFYMEQSNWELVSVTD